MFRIYEEKNPKVLLSLEYKEKMIDLIFPGGFQIDQGILNSKKYIPTKVYGIYHFGLWAFDWVLLNISIREEEIET